MGFRIVWHVPMYVIEHGFAQAQERFIHGLDYNLTIAAGRIQSYAQQNHVWQNRTGDAEREFAVEYGDKKMTMEHGVPYGKYLESMQGGRFGVIPMSLTYGKPIVNEALQRSLDEAFRW